MLKIGEFSKTVGLTVKALRHYENLGLIHPYWIDKYTGYRYYEESQVRLVRQIVYLKSLGFSLKEVQRLVSDDLSETERLRIFECKQHDVREQLEQGKWRLSALEQHLFHSFSQAHPDQPEKEISMELEIKQMPSIKVAGLLFVGKNEHQEIPALWGEFNERGEELCPRDTKVCYGVCRVQSYHQNGEFEYLAGVAVEDINNLPGDVVVREIPACEVAVFKHVGAADTLRQTYADIYNIWLPTSAYQPLEPGFDLEVYTEEFTYFAPDSVMYIYVPIKPTKVH